jgi:putative methionine-R-sulfoxide reductase with GAF domain
VLVVLGLQLAAAESCALWVLSGLRGAAVDGSKDELVVGAYQGAVLACGRIALGKGVCGTAWAERSVQNVPDVSAIENYVACDEDTLSECVVPVIDGADGTEGSGRVSSVLDIDSTVKAAFSKVDEECLAAIVAEFVAEPATVCKLGDDADAMSFAAASGWL